MEDRAGGKAAFRCFHGTLSKLAADVAAPKRELAVLDRSLLTRHAGTRPGVVPNSGDNAEVSGEGWSTSSRQRIGVYSAHRGGNLDSFQQPDDERWLGGSDRGGLINEKCMKTEHRRKQIERISKEASRHESSVNLLIR